MTKLIKELELQIKKWNGTVLGIDIAEYSNFINKNQLIFTCDTLDENVRGKKGKTKKGTSKKIIQIRKLKKSFQKNQYTYLLANLDILLPYKKQFVRDSVYIIETEIYLYTHQDIDLTHLIKMYERYAKVEVIALKDGTLLKIKELSKKTNWFYNKLYYLVDTIWNGFDYISDIMIG